MGLIWARMILCGLRISTGGLDAYGSSEKSVNRGVHGGASLH